MQQVRARVPRAVRVESGPSDVDARVLIARNEAELRATLSLSSPDGTTEREVTGRDCDELLRALALILAVALDPDAGTPQPPPPVATFAPAVAPAPDARGPSGGSPRPSIWLGAGARVGFASGVSPELTPYEGLYFAIGVENADWFSPSFRLSGIRASGTSHTAAGTAELDLLALRLAACPLRLGRSVYAEACATLDAGRLRGRGTSTANPRSESSAWYGPGGAIALGAVLFELLELGVEAGAVLPLARDRFYFGPDVTAHRVPRVAPYFGLGLGLRF